jgi:predicted CoA-substrate-specific enzyme activase
MSVLGIDIGSVALSVVEMSSRGEITRGDYAFHHGLIREKLAELLAGFDLRRIGKVACTSTTPALLRSARRVDVKVAYISAASHFHTRIGSLLIVGAERFWLIRFDEEGRYRNLKANSSCAAGTGSFLDQQARRLNLKGSAELSRLALENRGAVPRIASRCAVFAKTDLIHVQQAGYKLQEICDGLCLGLARNIIDALLSGEDLGEPIVFAGGVSKNAAVARHLETLLESRLLIGSRSHLYGAAGACLQVLEDENNHLEDALGLHRPEDLILSAPAKKEYYYSPLSLKLSEYPDFSQPGHAGSVFTPVVTDPGNAIELYPYGPLAPNPGADTRCYLGIDIGSTSTKAVIIDEQRRILAGFYTRTAGKPLSALQSLFEALADLLGRAGAKLEVLGVATTGSGREFIGRIIGADKIVNEITAHARAAYELDPEVDTIIEIGGQDSKFTTLREGMVTFAQMNTVCAAGTGSFIEEQADKLGVPLSEYSRLAEQVRSPLASNRCTVFMERDINHYLSMNYTPEEILAAALFSVRENYLLKVATPGLIGSHVCFQGATAKNRALVAAFEQRLEQPITVSAYCHLTGALGAALLLADVESSRSSFRGLDLYHDRIPIRAESCELCSNHCRLRIATVRGQDVAYGFLCGRDYDVRRYVSRNRSGFDLPAAVQKAFHFSPRAAASAPLIGLPAALHVYAELPLWKRFFSELGVPTVSSEDYTEALKEGKKLCRAEFCAPLAALHGHARYLAEKTDYLFLPIYLETGDNRAEHRHQGHTCYYTRFSSSLIASRDESMRQKCLMPLIGRRSRAREIVKQLYHTLKPLLPGLDEQTVSRAYQQAVVFYRRCSEDLRELYRRETREIRETHDIAVLLLGRPYVILSPLMNKRIPDLFAALGVKTFSQEMTAGLLAPGSDIEKLLAAFPWKFAGQILEGAALAARTDNLYPVLITSFKCAPDSFVVEYFRRILDKADKPYLILQIDEHDSAVGYQTRIEAGVHSFRNHLRGSADDDLQGGSEERPAKAVFFRAPRNDEGPAEIPPCEDPALPVVPNLEKRLEGKIVLFPNWDPLTCPLLVANLRHFGIDARLLEEDQLTIQKSMRHNSGQCIPLNIIAQEFVDYVDKHKLAPETAVLWTIGGNLSCNLPLYPHFIKSLLERYGGGMEKAGVYAGELSQLDISPLLVPNVYFSMLFGGLLRRLGCKIRPYEQVPGTTRRVINRALEIFISSFLGQISKEEALKEVLALFGAISTSVETRPHVAIFGDLYVRDNEVMNQNLIEVIEQAGGEVFSTPYSDYIKIVGGAYLQRWFKEKKYLHWLKNKTLLALVEILDKMYYPRFESFYGEPVSTRQRDLEGKLNRFNVRLEHDGESLDNILKIIHLCDRHPEISLFVQTNPAFCCPALVTEAMGETIERVTGVPVVTLTYDGTGGSKNDLVIPYLQYARLRSHPSS